MKKHSWISLLSKYSDVDRSFDDVIPSGATDADLRILLGASKQEGLTIPEDYVGFLRLRNGTSFNGLILYGANIQRDDKFRRKDLVVMNQFQLNRTNETVIGTSDQDAYVVIGKHGPYRQIERVSWDILAEFKTCDEMLFRIFAYQVEILKDV